MATNLKGKFSAHISTQSYSLVFMQVIVICPLLKKKVIVISELEHTCASTGKVTGKEASKGGGYLQERSNCWCKKTTG